MDHEQYGITAIDHRLDRGRRVSAGSELQLPQSGGSICRSQALQRLLPKTAGVPAGPAT